MHFYDDKPSVTTILDVRHKAALWEWKLRTPEAEQIGRDKAELGTAVHAMIETYLEDGEFDYDPDTPEGPYFKGFLSWYDTIKPTHCKTEQVLTSKKHGYAGTADLVCRINGEHYIVDWKTSNRINPGMGLQLAAYAQAYYELRRVRPRAIVVQLAPGIKRGYRTKEFAEPFEVFLAHKAIFDWSLRVGELELPVPRWDGGVITADQ